MLYKSTFYLLTYFAGCFVCEQHYSKSYGWIFTNLLEGVDLEIGNSHFDFGLIWIQRIFFSLFILWREIPLSLWGYITVGKATVRNWINADVSIHGNVGWGLHSLTGFSFLLLSCVGVGRVSWWMLEWLTATVWKNVVRWTLTPAPTTTKLQLSAKATERWVHSLPNSCCSPISAAGR